MLTWETWQVSGGSQLYRSELNETICDMRQFVTLVTSTNFKFHAKFF